MIYTEVSAVLDIYDLKAHERQDFVRRFLQAIIDAPKKLWHPVIIYLDEAHNYAPEKGKAESTGAVIDVATRGRKRGQALIVATQRLSKLHKDVAAEMLNKMIGRTGLDIDVKRAADELGMTAKEATATLRPLNPGSFYVFGSALSTTVQQIKVGPVQTTHPKTGHRMMTAPPAASAKIKKILASIGDLPKEAEAEAKSIGDLKLQVRTLKGEATRLAKSGGVDEKQVITRINAAVEAERERAESDRDEAIELAGDRGYEMGRGEVIESLGQISAIAEHFIAGHKTGGAQHKHTQPRKTAPLRRGPSRTPPSPIRQPARTPPNMSDNSRLRSGAIRILKELGARYPAGYSRSQVAVLTNFSVRGGTFNTYLGNLRQNSLVIETNKVSVANDILFPEL